MPTDTHAPRLTLISSNSEAETASAIDDLETVCSMLAEYILADGYEREDYQDSPAIPALRRFLPVLEAGGKGEVPSAIREVLRRARDASGT